MLGKLDPVNIDFLSPSIILDGDSSIKTRTQEASSKDDVSILDRPKPIVLKIGEVWKFDELTENIFSQIATYITKHSELKAIEVHFKKGKAFSFMQSDFMEAIQKHPHLKSVVLLNCSLVYLRDEFKKHKPEIQKCLDESACFNSFVFNYLSLTKSEK